MSETLEKDGRFIRSPAAQTEEATSGTGKKRWLNKGIYGSREVPVRILDTLILGCFAVILFLVIIFAVNGGYTVSFDTNGGTGITSLKLRYGVLAEKPQIPQKPGYTFVGWMTAKDMSLAEEWNFTEDKVEGDITLYAAWKPADITVKFDLSGGNLNGRKVAEDQQFVFGEAYGALPIPVKAGYRFDGWVYSGNVILSETVVTTSGEHVLTARWIPE